jgi:hypothetical protein
VVERLDLLGRLIVATRQLDMRLGPGTPIGWYADAFFEGNYLFEPSRTQATTTPPGQGPPV